MSIPSREGLTQEVPYRIDGLNVSVSREARVGRSGDSARERRVAVAPRDLRRRSRRQSLSRNAASATAAARARGTTTRLFAYCATRGQKMTVKS